MAKAWAAIAVIMILLSADEVGSIHERLTDLDGYIPILSYAAIYAALFGYAVVPMWRLGERRSVWTLGLGFLLLSTVPIQEIVEHNVNWGDLKAIRTVVEEGTELIGMLVLLWACMPNSGGKQGGEKAGSVTFDFVYCYRRNLLVVCAVGATVLAYVSAMLPDQERGHPADWFAAALFLSAGIAVARLVFQRAARFNIYVLVATMLCVFASVVSVAIAPDRLVVVPSIGEVAVKALVLSFSALALCVTWRFGRLHAGWIVAVSLMAIATVAIPLLSHNSLFALYAVPQYLALIVLAAHAVQYCRADHPGT